MKTLKQILGEQKAPETPKLGPYWTPEKIQLLKDTAHKKLPQQVADHFPDQTPRQVRYAKEVMGLQGKPSKQKFNDYWTPERKETLKQGILSGKTTKEMYRDHFPDAESHTTINYAVKKFGGELGVTSRLRHNRPEARASRTYWNDDRKYILRRAWAAGKPKEDIHLDHFSDIPFSTFHGIVSTKKKEFKLADRKDGLTRTKETYYTPIDAEAKQRIIADLGKTGANVDAVAAKHYANPAQVRRLKARHYPEHEITHSSIIPQEHIDFVKGIRTGQIPVQRANKEFSRPQNVGRFRIARELNKKFPGAQYQPSHVFALIRNGTFGIPGDRPGRPMAQGGKYAERRKAILQAHEAGIPHDVIAKTHGMKPSNVKSVIDTMSRAKKRVLGNKPVEEAHTLYMKNKVVESNDNENMNIKYWEDKVTHHESMIPHHEGKAAYHQNLHELTPEDSPFKKHHFDKWKEHEGLADHHAQALNRARFELRKQQIIAGKD